MYLTDLHIHSTFSDGKMTISEIVDFYGKRNFGAIAITDHICEMDSLIGTFAHFLKKTLTTKNFSEYIMTIEKEAKRAKRLYDITVISGFELSKNSLTNSRSAHVIALGIEKYISADQDLFDMLNECKDNNYLTIAAHPVSTRVFEKQTLHLWDNKDSIKHLIDAWEVASGPILFPEVLGSGLPMIANSDLHHPKQITSWKTEVFGSKDQDSIFKSIKTQNLQFAFYLDAHFDSIPHSIKVTKDKLILHSNPLQKWHEASL